MINITINGKQVKANENETILNVLQRENIDVPTLCHLKELSPSGACRLCIVEVKGIPSPVPSCSYPVKDGMVVKTHTPEIMEYRKTLIELLLADHPDDCLYCMKSNSCSLKDLAGKYNVVKRNYTRTEKRRYMDISSPSVMRDPSKCILCGKCVRVCEEIQGIAAIDFAGRGSKASIETAFKTDLNLSACVNCGQCVNVCPTGALVETPGLTAVISALQDENNFVTVQHAPAVSVSLGEEFGLPAGEDVDGKLVSVLRDIGFDAVFDTAFSADLTITEESAELVNRIETGGKLPLITSCCPGWIKLMEQNFTDFMENVSSCKSPQQMLGAIIKSYFAKKKNIPPSKIINVAVMPCTAKKFEAERPEMIDGQGNKDIDIVITTRELAKLIGIYGFDLKKTEISEADNPFGERSGAGKLFGASGGVAEAALRNAYVLLTGSGEKLEIEEIRGLDGIKQTVFKAGDITLKSLVVSGLKNAAEVLNKIRNGEINVDFIEIMACPGGCINGGGQPFNQNSETLKRRMEAIYKADKNSKTGISSENPEIRRIYEDFLGKPMSETSHGLLHTEYAGRKVIS